MTRVSAGTCFKAHQSILRINVSSRTNTYAPPVSDKRLCPKNPKIKLPYNKVVTAIAYTIAM